MHRGAEHALLSDAVDTPADGAGVSAQDRAIAFTKRANTTSRAVMCSPGFVWFVVDAAENGEFAAVRRIADRGALVHCPTETFWALPDRRSPHRRRSYRPLVPGMLFVGTRTLEETARDLFRRQIVTSATERPDRLLVVPGDVLAEFVDRHALKFANLREFVARFTAGTVVEITEGPFTGHTAPVEADSTAAGVRVAVSLFGRPTLATVPLDTVRAVA